MTAILLLLAAALGSPADDTERAAAIRLARETLGRELGVDPGELVVQDVTATEWTDSSLGCPAKETRYLPVLTPGHRVVLEHAGRALVTHVGAGRAVRCERGTTSLESDKRRGAATVARLMAEARLDLARRLGVPEGDVKAGALRRVTWPDASLGCPDPGKLYAQVQTEGFVIELLVAGARYRYHADREHAVFCPEQRRP